MPERRLQAENLHLWRGDRHVLKGVGFAVSAGECLQITGSNGAGAGVSSALRPEKGRILSPLLFDPNDIDLCLGHLKPKPYLSGS